MLTFGFQPVKAQQAEVQDLFVDYSRVLHVAGISPVHTVSNQPFSHKYLSRLDTLSGHPWQDLYSPPPEIINKRDVEFSLYDPELKTYWRNLQPGGGNNGAVWEGRGFTTSFSTGMYMRYRFLSAAIRPQILYNQNRKFSLSRYPFLLDDPRPSNPRSDFASPFYKIDLPQRFGNQPFWTFDAGSSYLKADVRGFEAGLSHQNRWWGPGQYYPILMGNNASGFWHFFAGTGEPKEIYIGDLETTLIWGKLLESDYFDEQSFNDERFITGLSILLNPKPVPNLTLGFSRVFIRTLPPEGIPVKDLFRVFTAFTKVNFVSDREPGGNDVFDQAFSVYGRWVFPESGFELYGEWARDDHSWNWRDALGEPEHSRAYAAGLQKTFTLPDRNILAIEAEIVQLEPAKTGRPEGSYYAHSIVKQGYTHKGQVLGVSTGPGSNSQRLTGKYYFKSGKLSGWFRRTVYNNDYLYRSALIRNQPGNSGIQKFWLHNFEIGMGASLVLFRDRWEAELGMEVMREYNDDFIYEKDLTHLALNLRLRYRISPLR